LVNTSDKLIKKISDYRPDAIGFHFIQGWMYKEVVKPFGGPVFIWVHGGEALGWYRRLFMFSFANLYTFTRYIGRNLIQMTQMHNLISYANTSAQNRIHFIFVSRWMRSITETDTISTVKNVRYIPNPIDPTLFRYAEKTAEQRKKILLIRSFDSKKYANDLAVEAISILSKKPFFSELSFTIYGVGKYFQPLTKRIKEFPNVTLNNFFLENKNIPAVHREHGVFLCPTRQDAQGVSMCEAMSSGLVPITSNNTAIPEFVEDKKSGFLTQTPEDIATAIELLYREPGRFLAMSHETSAHIQRISGTPTVVEQEVLMIQKGLAFAKTDNGLVSK
jgi:glycosyltransferase involved in cell wall biosynthesis